MSAPASAPSTSATCFPACIGYLVSTCGESNCGCLCAKLYNLQDFPGLFRPCGQVRQCVAAPLTCKIRKWGTIEMLYLSDRSDTSSASTCVQQLQSRRKARLLFEQYRQAEAGNCTTLTRTKLAPGCCFANSAKTASICSQGMHHGAQK